MSFLNVIRKRLYLLVFVLFGVSLITFTISNVVPGDPARMIAGERAPAEVVERIRNDLDLNKSLPEQYIRYMKGIFTGDLGTSIRTKRPVLEDLKLFFPATMELAVVALFIAAFIAIPLGVASAIWKNTFIDYAVRLMAVIGISTPAFWLGMLVIVLFYAQLQILPSGGRISPSIMMPPKLTGFLLLDSLLAGNFAAFWSALKHIILPAMTLGFVHLGVVARQIRSAMMDEMHQDYIRTANANGISKFRIIFAEALPNALIPSITVMGLALGDLLYGAVLTESVFAWPGMGRYVVDSILSLDFPAIMGFTLVVCVAYVFVNLIVDLIYMLVDPRIRNIS
ncbi:MULTISPECIES: ABC transporter permease [Bartonella]|uniref:ABC transporter permease n=1 Tax=Bartonella TaxID=773 RepID=UPI0018DE597D|nr:MULTISPECIES: ABC transporter permease [Bartonella]MBH9994609.1 ABC transporter permease [Bartonella sp. P0291]MBH9997046.1 ABC transporter permease [Bartonella sp. M0192]MBH9999206.1 ABC transporter permease [Bartonella sp. M0191]MBI0008409.1 ABC transporter permease [Bartonella sp. M0193]MBI0010497.1 ABC transporter permease [Bartonella sp. M0176]